MKQEENRLNAGQVNLETSRKPVEVKHITYLHGHALAVVYSVRTRLGGQVYMCMNRGNGNNNRTAVVIADSSKFLRAWRANAAPALAGHVLWLLDPLFRILWPNTRRDECWLPWLSRSAWLSDYKYKDAHAGFNSGATNPVPLAYVGLGFSAKSIAFSNGITRTLWLLSHDASAFPVSCSTEEADTIQQLVGVSWAKWQTVEEITSGYTWEQYLAERES